MKTLKNSILTIFVFLFTLTVSAQIDYYSVDAGQYVIYNVGAGDTLTVDKKYNSAATIAYRNHVEVVDTILKIPATASDDTITTLLAAADAIDDSVRVGLLVERGSHRRTSITVPRSNMYIGAYGTGEKPIIDGADVISGMTNSFDTTTIVFNELKFLTEWIVVGGGVTRIDDNSFSTTGVGGVATSADILTVGNWYKLVFYSDNALASPRLYNGVNTQTIGTGDGTYIFQASYPQLYIRLPSAGTCNVSEYTITEYNPGSPNLWKKSGITEEPEIMYLSGVGGNRETSIVDCDSIGKWFWDSETDVLYVYSTTDPSGNIELGQRSTLVNLGAHKYITFKNVTIQHSNGNAVRGIGGGNLTFSGCTVQKNALNGIFISNSSNLTFDSNTVTDNGLLRDVYEDGNGNGVKVLTTIAGISNMTFINNDVSYSGAYNTVFRTADAAPRMKNVTIHGNSFDNARGAGLYIQMTDSVDIYNNTFDSNGDADTPEEDYAIGVQSCSNVNIYQNTIENTMGNASAIEVYTDELAVNGPAHNVKIFRNSFSGSEHRTISITGYGNNSHQNLEIYSNVITGSVSLPIALLGDDSGTRDTVNIFNNTFYGNAGGILYIHKDWPVVLKNNIFYSDISYSVVHLSTVEGFLTTSNNLYVRTNGGTLVNYRGTYTSATITDFEPSAQKTDPLFTDTANRDFTLQAGSPAINAGVDVGLTTDILGNPIVGAPDIGCYEYQP